MSADSWTPGNAETYPYRVLGGSGRVVASFTSLEEAEAHAAAHPAFYVTTRKPTNPTGGTMKKRKRCPECGQLIPVRQDGSLKRHGSAWVNPPPGAPICPGERRKS